MKGEGTQARRDARQRSLSEQVLALPRKELVIGVAVSEVLSHVGVALAPNASGLSFRTKEVVAFDTFLSHNWDTPRLHRYLALCLETNFVPASISVLIIFVLCVLASIVGILPVFEVELVGGAHTVQGPLATLLAVPVYWL